MEGREGGKYYGCHEPLWRRLLPQLDPVDLLQDHSAWLLEMVSGTMYRINCQGDAEAVDGFDFG
jgi:hypothetical protein